MDIDLSTFHEGEPLEAPSVTGFLYEMGAESPIAGLTGHLVGCESGDVVEFRAPLSVDVGDLLEGDQVEVRVAVEEVMEKSLPELDDDEWVSDFTDFDTVRELKDQVSSEMAEARLESLRAQLRDALVTELTGEVALDIPGAIIDASASQMFESMRQRLEDAGTSLDEYLEMAGQDGETIFGELQARAKSRIEVRALLDSVAEHAGLEVGGG